MLPGKPTDNGGRAADKRQFFEAVLFLARTGSPWRDLPKELGNWYSVYVRLACWEGYGVWHRVAEALQGDADLEELFIDATIVRVHDRQTPKTVVIRRPAVREEGWRPKFMPVGNPVRPILTVGQIADIRRGAALVEAMPNGAVIPKMPGLRRFAWPAKNAKRETYCRLNYACVFAKYPLPPYTSARITPRAGPFPPG